MTTLFIDADACPVREEICRVAGRHWLDVILVTNGSVRPPGYERVRVVLVPEGPDAADDWIAERIEAGDLCITADIPLASRCLAKGARVVSPIGRPFTPENIGQALAMRDLSRHLREIGVSAGGPSTLTKADRSRFLDVLETTLRAIAKNGV